MTNKLTTMSFMFYQCKSIISIDLSNFKTENVAEIQYMIYMCTSVKAIDLSNHNYEHLKSKYSSYMEAIPNLKYINLKNFKLSPQMNISLLPLLKNTANLIICGVPSGYSTISKDICCNYDTENDKCDYSNYISVYYDIDEINHQFSLACNECYENVGFLMIGESMLSKREKFNLTKETKLEIHFANPLVNISNFFKGIEKIKSIDLSTLNSSKLIDMSSIFNGCSSLESINLSNLNVSLVTNMSSMFAGCSSLNSLNLSSFNTPLLTNMNEIFNGCTSLASLDLSNFDMGKCIYYENIFSDISSIRYLNLHYFKNDKIFSTLFNEASDIIVCQTEEIVKSPNAIYCCNYDFAAKKCLEPVPTTILIQSASSLIKSTTDLTTTIEQTTDTLQNNTTSIATTQIINDISATLVVIGFSTFRNLYTLISFYIYLSFSNDLLYSTNLKFPVVISSNRILRTLETYDTYEANCKIDGERKKNIYTYFCQIQAQIENIRSVKIIDIDKFQFDWSNIVISLKNVEIIASPLAEILMDNLQSVPDKLDALRNSSYYFLNHSKIDRDENIYFNISGLIDQKPKFGKGEIQLMTYTKSEVEILQSEINCSIIDLINYNYTLKCKGIESEQYNLQNALSIISDEILIITFDNGDNSTISFEVSQKNDDHRIFLSKKTGNLSPGIIVAIILVIIIVIAIIIASIVCWRKGKHIEKSDSASSLKI